MRLALTRVEAEVDGGRAGAPVTGDGAVTIGPLEVVLATGGPAADGPDSARANAAGAVTPGTIEVGWTVANRGDGATQVRSVALVFRVVGAEGPLRLFRNGYQSWTPTGMATFGTDVDPSSVARFEFLQAVHHADQRTVTAPGELRSEWVTLLADGRGRLVLAGFDDGRSHDGTLRLRHAEAGGGGTAGGGRADAGRQGGGVELWAEAFLGDAVLPAGATRTLHTVTVEHGGPGTGATPTGLLDRWATRAGRAGRARAEAPYQVGWCSWYQYFTGVTEDVVRRNLALADRWPFELFQLDDGYQASIGDWLTPNADFPSGLPGIAEAIATAGRRPGVWLAPFLAAPDSRMATDHPHWLARTADGTHPLRAWWNPDWGGGDGFFYALDTTDPAVLAHLEHLAAALVAMGFAYLKLDFTFAPSVDGRWRDPTRTPAERVRAGFDAIRRGAGDDTFILGCGVPLANVVGVVDGCRIGQDVAPRWALSPTDEIVPGYLGIQPSTQHAYVNTATRSFMHRRLWINDPDCVMLRTADTALSPEAARTWARAVGVSGGMALVSDDLALLDDRSRRLLDETVALGRASDDAVRAGHPVIVPDLLDAARPHRLESAGRRLTVDVDTGSSTLTET